MSRVRGDGRRSAVRAEIRLTGADDGDLRLLYRWDVAAEGTAAGVGPMGINRGISGKLIAGCDLCSAARCGVPTIKAVSFAKLIFSAISPSRS